MLLCSSPTLSVNDWKYSRQRLLFCRLHSVNLLLRCIQARTISPLVISHGIRIKFTKVFSCMATYFHLIPCKVFVSKQSFIKRKMWNLGRYNIKRYIAPSSIINIIFSEAFNFIVLYFNLVLFKGLVGKQLKKKYTLECTARVHWGCTFRLYWSRVP